MIWWASGWLLQTPNKQFFSYILLRKQAIDLMRCYWCTHWMRPTRFPTHRRKKKEQKQIGLESGHQSLRTFFLFQHYFSHVMRNFNLRETSFHQEINKYWMRLLQMSCIFSPGFHENSVIFLMKTTANSIIYVNLSLTSLQAMWYKNPLSIFLNMLDFISTNWNK